MLSLPYLRVKAEHYICKLKLHVLRQENLDYANHYLKIYLNPGLDLRIFQGTGP